jgi:hypothetical protein
MGMANTTRRGKEMMKTLVAKYPGEYGDFAEEKGEEPAERSYTII